NRKLDPRVEVSVGSDSPTKLSNPNPFSCLFEPFFRPAKFIKHQRQLQSERDRFGMDTVTAPDHWRHFVLAGLGRNHRPEFLQITSKNPGCFHQLNGKGRIQNVRRGETLMDPARGWTN